MIEPPWQPLLVGDTANDVRRIVDDIVAALVERPPIQLPGFKGDAATALLLAVCGSPAAGARLEQALVMGTAPPLTIALFGGLGAAAWLLEEFADGSDVAAIVEHFDTALTRHLDVPRWQDRKDLMSGLAGVGVMLAARHDACARAMGERVLAHLEASAEVSGTGVTWRNEPQFLPEAERISFPDGMIDLGVAHGVPGIIGMLAQFIEAGIEPDRSRALLRRAVAWLLESVPPDCPRFGSSWPGDDTSKRIAWCHGDAGIGAVLLLASRALDSQELAAEAVALLRQSIAALAKQGAPDAGFCHGAAGLAHIYNVAFQRTGDSDLRDEAVRWLREVIRMRSPDTGIAGYRSQTADGRWHEDATLLTGVVGTALVLIAAIEDREPAWQRLFVM